MELPTTEEIKGYVADFRAFLQEGTFPERKALIRNFVEGIEVTGDEAVLTYTEPVIEDSGSVEDVHHLWLMALLQELVPEKGNRGGVCVGHRPQDGGPRA